MSVNTEAKTLSFRIGEKFSTDFDELQNIGIENRKSDIGFSEFGQMVIKMRDGTVQIGNTLTGAGGVSGQYFFVDFFKKKSHIKGFNKKVWRLDGETWVDLGVDFTSNNFFFNPMLLPMKLDGSASTIYTTGSDSSEAERVKKDSNDALGAAAIGKYLIITYNSGNSQAYRGAFASILDYDTDTSEYTLNGAGITTVLKSGAKYQIYDTLGEYLQISNGIEYERYFFGKEDGTIVENTSFRGLATLGLRNVKGILDTEFLLKQISYYGSYWTFNKNTLYYSAGALNNPFLYNFTTVLSVPGNISGKINDLFVFKDRLIIGGDTYSAYLRGPLSSITEISLITQSYGITPKTLVDVGIDAYFISTNQHIYSLKENIAGTAIEATDEGKIIGNYLKDYNFNLMGAFDGSKLYFYGEKVEGETGVTTVLDIQYKFWSTYTGLSPSDIIFNGGKIYLSDNNSDKVRVFDSDIQDDIGNPIEQKVALKDITLGLPFTLKGITDLYLWLDNFPQEFYVKMYLANPGNNTNKSIKKISFSKEEVEANSDSMGLGILGKGILGGKSVDKNITLPMMKHIAYEFDNAFIWKVVLIGKDGSPFYLNQLDIEVAINNQKQYFPPEHTI